MTVKRLTADRRSVVLRLLFAAAILLCGCAGEPASAENYDVSEEQKLVVYTSHKEEVYGPIIQEFEERTGIWVQVRAGGTTELLEAIKAEDGQPVCDVMFGGGVEGYEAYQECFASYRCSQKDMLYEDYASAGDKWTVFTELPIVFIYNHKLVSSEDAPAGWEELLTEKWRGKIAFANPGMSGSSSTALSTMIQVLGGDEEEVMERFAAVLDGHVSEGSKAVVDEVGAGSRLIGITLEETARKRIAQGADISMIYPIEGTSAVPDGCALVKNAAHEENARLFLDFTVSEDVQKMVVEGFMRRSVRKDIRKVSQQIDFTNIHFDLEWGSKNQERILNLWEDLMK